jgi:D-glycero-D-manno-heptose 1,7-bisphosphate phosphatase
MRAAAFLDRDGTIIEDVDYLRRLEDFRMLPGAPDGILALNRAGIPVVVVTNQSAVARGYITEEFVSIVHRHLASELSRGGAHVDAFYYCPHHPAGTVPGFRCECTCRKPGTGMLSRAASELGIDLAASYLVGDKLLDIETARRAGARGILVTTGCGAGELGRLPAARLAAPAHVASDLVEAATWIVQDLARETCGPRGTR